MSKRDESTDRTIDLLATGAGEPMNTYDADAGHAMYGKDWTPDIPTGVDTSVMSYKDDETGERYTSVETDSGTSRFIDDDSGKPTYESRDGEVILDRRE